VSPGRTRPRKSLTDHPEDGPSAAQGPGLSGPARPPAASRRPLGELLGRRGRAEVRPGLSSSLQRREPAGDSEGIFRRRHPPGKTSPAGATTLQSGSRRPHRRRPGGPPPINLPKTVRSASRYRRQFRAAVRARPGKPYDHSSRIRIRVRPALASLQVLEKSSSCSGEIPPCWPGSARPDHGCRAPPAHDRVGRRLIVRSRGTITVSEAWPRSRPGSPGRPASQAEPDRRAGRRRGRGRTPANFGHRRPPGGRHGRCGSADSSHRSRSWSSGSSRPCHAPPDTHRQAAPPSVGAPYGSGRRAALTASPRQVRRGADQRVPGGDQSRSRFPSTSQR